MCNQGLTFMTLMTLRALMTLLLLTFDDLQSCPTASKKLIKQFKNLTFLMDDKHNCKKE